MARGEAFFGENRHGRQRQRRLGDIFCGVGDQLGAERRHLALRCGGADEHAIAARPVHFLDHQLLQLAQHFGQLVGLAAPPRRHIGQQRLLTRIKLHNLGHIAVQRLVIGNAGARRVGDGDAPGAIDVEDAGDAQHRIGPEIQRIKIVVVNAAIDDVDRLVAARRAHRDAPVDDAQIAPFDQFNPHLVRQKAVFEIGGVENARRQYDHGWRARTGGRRAGGERAAQPSGIVADLAHRNPAEQFGKHLEHGFPVFQHIADPRRGPGIVLEHIKVIRPGAHNVGADDMGIDAAGRIDADHLGQKRLILGDHRGRNASGAQDFLAVIDVVQEGVDRAHALFNALGQPSPFARRHDARDNIERDQPLVGLGRAIDVEGDAGLAKKGLGLCRLAAQMVGLLARKPFREVAIGVKRCAAGAQHFVKGKSVVCHYPPPLPDAAPSPLNCQAIGAV